MQGQRVTHAKRCRQSVKVQPGVRHQGHSSLCYCGVLCAQARGLPGRQAVLLTPAGWHPGGRSGARAAGCTRAPRARAPAQSCGVPGGGRQAAHGGRAEACPCRQRRRQQPPAASKRGAHLRRVMDTRREDTGGTQCMALSPPCPCSTHTEPAGRRGAGGSCKRSSAMQGAGRRRRMHASRWGRRLHAQRSSWPPRQRRTCGQRDLGRAAAVTRHKLARPRRHQLLRGGRKWKGRGQRRVGRRVGGTCATGVLPLASCRGPAGAVFPLPVRLANSPPPAQTRWPAR